MDYFLSLDSLVMKLLNLNLKKVKTVKSDLFETYDLILRT